MPRFFSSPEKCVIRITEAVPADGHRQHAKARAQVARHQFHGRDITAVTGDEDKLAQPRARETFAKLDPGGDGRLRRECQRSRVSEVLGRNANPLDRQKGDRKVVGQSFARAAEISLGNEAIDAERQMRPVLFDRRERQHRDPAIGRRAGDLLPGHFQPVALRQRHRAPLTCSIGLTLIPACSIVASAANRSNGCRWRLRFGSDR
jgi:hypothetical protein